jgi:formylglycine-generating enzyme required for sulfatase activity
VALNAYAIDVTEVRQAAYQCCVAAGACTPPQYPTGCPYDPAAAPDEAVVGVTWAQAAAYCAYAGGRLPTEAEWERAARGTDERLYPWGDTAPTCSLANLFLCSAGRADVGSRPSGVSPVGALDMAGNVWEWVADWFSDSYYAQSPSSDPQGPADGSANGNKVIRGGSTGENDPAQWVRASKRYSFNPIVGFCGLGFRCAR